MENTIQLNSTDIIALAKEKVKSEFEKFTGGIREKAVSSYVNNKIQEFCQQDARFAEVVYNFKRTLSDCCAYAVKGVEAHISDIDVYRNAVKFYFPNSEVSMVMTIEITGEAPGADEVLKETEKPKAKAAVVKKDKPAVIKAEKKGPAGPIQLSMF